MSSFDDAFDAVIGVEGGYVNDPADPGGETKYGITKRSYPNLDIANLTLDEAKAIYQRDYWNPLSLDTEPYSVALLLFDAAVNQGVNFAHFLPHDEVGIGTARAMHYFANPHFNTFGKGWLNRLFIIFKKALT
jgi:lysozyme family protein